MSAVSGEEAVMMVKAGAAEWHSGTGSETAGTQILAHMGSPHLEGGNFSY